MTKAELLDTAKATVTGENQQSYGDIAKLWSIVLDKEITPGQVAQCMILLKLARLMKSPKHTDSIVDIAGYAACLAEIESNVV